MTDIQDNKPKKLTLDRTKLSFGKSIDHANVSRSVIGSKSNTIVEVKKSKVIGSTTSSPVATTDSDHEEFNKRLSLLKRAADDKIRDSESKISTLSKLVAMNQLKVEQVITNERSDSTPKQPAVAASIDVEDSGDKKLQTIAPERSGGIGRPLVNEVFEEENGVKKKIGDTKAAPQKAKVEEPKKLKKSDIFHMLEGEEGAGANKGRSLASIRRAKEKAKRKQEILQKHDKIYREVIIPEVITVSELAGRMAERVADVIRELMKLGVMATALQSIDADTAELIVTAFGHSAKRVQESDVENILIQEIDTAENLQPRAPVVTVMGHVDHGKTSLLDALKSTDIVSYEAGGITQHIGAYRVTLANGKAITFIDTPGHEAFTEMRIRGAQVTDIVILVVAADDGIKAQTIEAINHAKAAGVPIVVAINKIDKPDINLDRVKNELLMHELVAEDLGGDTMVIPVSALKKINLDKLEEAVLLLAEMQDLKANPAAPASGIVIESRIDKGKGIIATILIQRGTLKNSDLMVAGSTYGRIKRINNDKGIDILSAGPTEPVEIYGLNEAPRAGDRFDVILNEKHARDITEYRMRLLKEKKVAVTKGSSLEDLFMKASGVGGIKELAIIIKGDVQGSVEAIATSLLKLPNDEVRVKILHQAVGGITESDVTLARASNAIILGFNVRSNANAASMAEKDKADIRYYSIIYNLIDDMKAIMNGMLSPIMREQFIGSVVIRQIFNITKIGKVAGSYVTKGVIKRGAGVRLLRDDIVIHEGKLKTLKRFKEDVKEVKEGFECGIAFENYDDIKVTDTVEVFEVIEEKKQLF
ncbi:Translation initiation factor IF-2 [Candidatus Trichorickettsia mobilis]|uniref:Translation initiation factor IF-2 n=1 Tax=Candidatus Trichorickettsia mobilis TaxID=1346319 RepID=A0ABZ0USU6_9RICK|nr:translation initiation factor IF-2 [Candidatus Trichorickettsia mobilis]WPY01097.1 Translation initiation factor IF-2 [Candidatus Trichorickettsia mobilis]